MGKYNYDKIPALKYLKMDEISKEVRIFENDGFLRKEGEMWEYFFKEHWEIERKFLSKNVVVASKKFLDTVFLYEKQMLKIVEQVFVKGMTIEPSFITNIDATGNVTFLKLWSDDEITYFGYSQFTKNGVFLIAFEWAFNKREPEGLKNPYINHLLSNNLKEYIDVPEMGNRHPLMIFISLVWTELIILLFQKYAKVETKVFPAKTKTRTFRGKYLNETDFDIIHLDSTWFTNLVQSNAFNVRGHFRLQPKKANGEWTKELIWIDDFQKNGYTKKAQMLRTENEYLISKESMLE